MKLKQQRRIKKIAQINLTSTLLVSNEDEAMDDIENEAEREDAGAPKDND
jgi:hypothetical protein